MEIYLPGPVYDRLVQAMLDLRPDPMTGKIEADAVKIALGEIADIWPMTIRPELDIDRGEFGECWPN